MKSRVEKETTVDSSSIFLYTTPESAARSTKVSLRKVGTREEKGMGAWAAPREDELGKVRYKPEELGLYIDDPHATLKPELQRPVLHRLQDQNSFSGLSN